MIQLNLTVCQAVTLTFSIPILTLQSPHPKPSPSHYCTSTNIIPVCWGHVAQPVRLNPNQFLSNGRRKVPNRVYARLIQSACGWGKDDCAIMSSLISFRQAGRQTGRPAQWGWSWRDAHCHQAWLDELSAKYHGCQRVSVVKTPGQNPGLERQKERNVLRQRVGRQENKETEWQLKENPRLKILESSVSLPYPKWSSGNA